MRLLRARVTNYRSIDDSGWVDCNQDVICLVGKNESGKTSFLQALHRLSPISGSGAEFQYEKDYPRKGLNAYKRTHASKPEITVRAEFELNQEDANDLNGEFGDDVVRPQTITVARDYANNRLVTCSHDEPAAVMSAILASKPSEEILAKVAKKPTLTELEALATADASLAPTLAVVRKKFPRGVALAVQDAIYNDVPDFLYFDDYSVMKGRISLPRIQQLWRQRKQDENMRIDRNDRTFMALLEMASTNPDELLSAKANVETLTATLEAAAIDITKDVFRYWTQDARLRVKFSVQEPDNDDRKDNREGPVFHTRIWNDRHQMTVSFDERSKGFVWFFSFLTYFSRVKDHPRPIVLLLDEPGLSLHANAQNDFLRFINERLANDHQVLYTTHSPFMVDPNHPSRIRTVEDVDDKGTVIRADWLKGREGGDTLYPLMAAMGIEMTQTLFIGPNSLLVEGPSELLYFPAIAGQLHAAKRTVLDPRWTLTPINGANKAPAFVSLFGANKVHISIVMDYEPKQKQLLETLQANKFLGNDHVIPVTDITKGKEADIEDLFAVDDYLAFVNATYARELPAPLNKNDLPAGERIVKRLEHYFEAQQIAGGRFDHGRVAEYYATRMGDHTLTSATLANFEALFKRLNDLLA